METKMLVIFSQGFALGYLLSEFMNKLKPQKSLVEHKKEKYNDLCIKKMDFICKITDNEMFNIIFPEYDNVPKVQPGWTYHPDKQVIKIDLNQEIVEYLNSLEIFEYNFDELFLIKQTKQEQEQKQEDNYLIDIDYELFKSIGNCYIYIEYTINNKDYINVYKKGNEILSTQFEYLNNNKETKFVIYSKNKDTPNDITDYFNKFINNDIILTPEEILIYDDTITHNLEQTTIEIIEYSTISKYTHSSPILFPIN